MVRPNKQIEEGADVLEEHQFTSTESVQPSSDGVRKASHAALDKKPLNFASSGLIEVSTLKEKLGVFF